MRIHRIDAYVANIGRRNVSVYGVVRAIGLMQDTQRDRLRYRHIFRLLGGDIEAFKVRVKLFNYFFFSSPSMQAFNSPNSTC